MPLTAAFLIIEDHPIFRQALVTLLGDAFPDSSFVTAGTLDEAKQILVRSEPPPIVILDVNLPDSHGTEGARELLHLAPKLKIIALSADDSARQQARLLKLGVRGFLPKTLAPEIFIRRLDRLIRERLGEEKATAEMKMREERRTLSSRQHAVMVEMARGHSNKEIALSLGIGVETVKTHVSEIIRRLGVRNRAEAIRYFLKQEVPVAAGE